MPRKDKVIHISNLPSTFRGNITRNGRFIQNGIPPLGGAYDKVAKSTGLIRLGNEFLYNGVNNLVSKDNREKLMNNTAGRLINYVKDFNKESFPSDDELGPTSPFNIIQTPRSNGKKLPQKQYAVGGKIPNVVAGGIAQPLGNNFFYMNGRKHSRGGIDIGPSDKTGIEVEDGEVVETNGNELKVYSAQPIINGVSPAKLVMGGANPDKVFKAQEDFKDRNGINDDGTKAKYGKEKYVVKSDNTRVTPIMESPRNSGIKQGDFIYYPETYRIANNTLEKVPARKEVNMTPLEQVNPEFDILLGGAGVLRGVDKATKVAMALDKNISRASQKVITKGRDALGYYSISPNIRYNLSVNNGRKALGVEPTPENRAKYYASTYAPDTGAGRAGFNSSYNGEGTIYSSNSLNTGIGYAKAKHRNEKDGFVVSVRRPIKFEGNRENWVKNADFGFDNSKRSRLYADYELPYLLRYGKSARTELSKNKTIPYKDIVSKVNKINKGIPYTRDHFGKYTKGYSRKSRKLGGKNMIVSISGNVKNGLIHSPSSTGGLRDKFAVGGSDHTFRNRRRSKNSITNNNVNTNKSNIDNGKGQGKFKNLTTADWIGLGSNVAGSLASYFASRRAINKMRSPGQPTLISANKLKTKYNINPQLDRIREDKFEAYRDIDSNTASSRVSLARKQRVRNAAGQAANELYGNKENIETNLINQDRHNQQSVRQFNAQQYNQYIDRKAAFDNGIREAKVTNINNLFSGINAGIQDMISRYENRKALNNTIAAMRASAPNVDDRIMRDAGVDYDEFIIRKRRKLGGKQSCR